MGQTNCCASSRQSGRVWGRSLHYAECLRALLIYQVMARLWSCQPNSSHSTFLHSISSYSITTNPTQSKPSSAFFIYGSDSLSAKSSHIIRRAHAHANCPHPAGSCSSDCFRIIAPWFGQFVSRFQTIIC